MNAVCEKAPAKVNLYLHVTGRRADGYHLLDSLFAFAADGDVVTVRSAETLSLRICMPNGIWKDWCVITQDFSERLSSRER